MVVNLDGRPQGEVHWMFWNFQDFRKTKKDGKHEIFLDRFGESFYWLIFEGAGMNDTSR
jgi:hypothetical protein